MKAILRLSSVLAACCITAWTAIRTQAQPAGQWDFEAGDLSATVGAALTYLDGAGGATQTGTQFGTTTALGIPDISGAPAKVMKFPASSAATVGFNMPTPGGNGGGSLVNNYTIIFDLLYPPASDAKVRPLLQTSDGSLGVAETAYGIGANNGLGILPNTAFAKINPNTWYRVGIVHDSALGKSIFYINGVQVGIADGAAVDGKYALAAGGVAQLFNNNAINPAGGYVNSIQLRDVALNAGQLSALGGPSVTGIVQTIPPVSAFISARTPDIGATGVSPLPSIDVTLNRGDSTVTDSSIKLLLDNTLVDATITPSGDTYDIAYTVTNILAPTSIHNLALVSSDSIAGLQTNSWSFTIAQYQNVTLPAPIYLETFDELAEGTLPDGWSVTNRTSVLVAGLDLDNTQSDSYLDWVVIDHDHWLTVYPDTETDPLTQTDHNLRDIHPAIVVNGVLLDSLTSSNLIVAESDQRGGGGQVNVLFTKDYDLTGHTNIFVAFYSSYEQNQNNEGALEYSIDHGANWNPVVYLLDKADAGGDILYKVDGSIDVAATFNKATDSAYGLPYGTWIAAPISDALAPFISGRVNDDYVESKRVEVYRLPLADNQGAVRFRFMQAGHASWYWGVDNFGLYTINTPVISTQPTAQTIDAATPVTFTVAANGSGNLTYQWLKDGAQISGATSASYTIALVSPSDAGSYSVVVRNSDGPTTSASVALTVVTAPQITADPRSQVGDANTAVTLTASGRGGRPLGYTWLFNGAAVASGLGSDMNYLIPNATTANNGAYQLVLSNNFGMITSSVANLTIFGGKITNDLVVHLTFDGNYDDTSGKANNGSDVGGTTFEAGKIGQAVKTTTTTDSSVINYVALGYPEDLKFGESTDFSVSMWVKYTNQVDDPPFISNKNWQSSGNRGWGIFTQGGGNTRIQLTGTGGNNFSSSATPQLRDGNWHQIAISVVRNGYVYTYADGVLVSRLALLTSGTIDTDDLGENVNIGQDGTGGYTDGGSAGMEAVIDDVGIWRRAITGNEAASIFAQGLAGSDLTTASGAPVVLPPGISTQPASQVVSAGANATFGVTATGGTLAYQWQANGTNIAGQTGSTLILNAVDASAAGDYRVIVSNPAGSITSAPPAHLEVFSGTLGQDLVLNLKFDGDYLDASGRGNNATPSGPSPGFAAGKLGQAFHFITKADGSVINYATLGAPTDLLFGTGNFTVSIWVNYSAQTDDPPFISNKDWGSSSNIGWGIFSQEDGVFRIVATGTPRGGDNKMDTKAVPNIHDGNWHHIIVSFWRGQVTQTYLDGTSVNTTPLLIAGSVDTADQGFAVNIGQDGKGTYTDGGSASIDGLIDDVAIWRRVVTPQEDAQIFAAGTAGHDLSSLTGGAGSQPELETPTISGSTITITWSGTGSFQLQKRTALDSGTWQNVGAVTTGNSATDTISGSTAFYRVQKL